MPDHIEGLYEKMMEQYLKPSQAWDRMDAFTAGWLHVYCKQQADLAMARLPDDLEKEMRVRFILLTPNVGGLIMVVGHMPAEEREGLPCRRREGRTVAEEGSDA